MTLREQQTQLENNINNTFNNLMNIGDYDLLTNVIKRDYDSLADEILAEIDESGITETNQNYDFAEGLTQIYYNDRRGDERMAYLLSVEKENGIYVLDNEDYNTIYIGFSDLNGLYSKITVIEDIQNA